MTFVTLYTVGKYMMMMMMNQWRSQRGGAGCPFVIKK